MSVESYATAAFTRLTASQVDTIKHMAAMNGLRFSAQVRALIELGLAVATIKEETNP